MGNVEPVSLVLGYPTNDAAQARRPPPDCDVRDLANFGEKAPRHRINSDAVRRSSILAPTVKTMKAADVWTLRSRLAVRKVPWTPALAEWNQDMWEDAGR